jgi:hypothetical protein
MNPKRKIENIKKKKEIPNATKKFILLDLYSIPISFVKFPKMYEEFRF